jgi:hypothetical protein
MAAAPEKLMPNELQSARMANVEPSRGLSPRRRLQIVLILLILWDVIGILTELSFPSALFKISDGKIGGLLAARGSFGGALVVPLTLYIYALVRGPLRYRGLVWIGVLEQSMVLVLSVYHVAASDIKTEGAVLPMLISAGMVVLLLLNMPRGQPSGEG